MLAIKDQQMKVTSKDVYKILREILAPELKVAGFKRTPGGLLGWQKPSSGRQLSFWFQCDRYGWFQDFGSKVTLELQLAEDERPAYGSLRDRKRFAQLLTDAELDLVRTLNNDVIHSLPPLSPSNPIFSLGAEGEKWFMSDYQVRREPYARNQDVWLHYFTPAHVEVWGEFFSDRILRICDAFLDSAKRET